MSSFKSLCQAIRGALVTLPFIGHLVVADLFLSILLPFSFLLPSTVYNISSRIAGPVWAHIQGIFQSINGASVQRSPTSSQIPRGESAIVIANHVAWTDFYMIQSFAQGAGMLHRCRWFAKSQLRWVPLLGWGLWAMGMPLVTRDWAHDREEMERIFGSIRDMRWPICKIRPFILSHYGGC